jgi:hypothetical protein
MRALATLLALGALALACLAAQARAGAVFGAPCGDCAEYVIDTSGELYEVAEKTTRVADGEVAFDSAHALVTAMLELDSSVAAPPTPLPPTDAARKTVAVSSANVNDRAAKEPEAPTPLKCSCEFQPLAQRPRTIRAKKNADAKKNIAKEKAPKAKAGDKSNAAGGKSAGNSDTGANTKSPGNASNKAKFTEKLMTYDADETADYARQREEDEREVREMEGAVRAEEQRTHTQDNEDEERDSFVQEPDAAAAAAFLQLNPSGKRV